MTRLNLGLFALGCITLAACNGGGEDDTSDTECLNSVVSTFPADQEAQAYYRTTIEVEFDDAEDGATFTVSDGSGEVSGTHQWLEETLIFTPDSPLAPNTAYTVDITYSCGNPSITFQTSEVGTATTPGDLVGTSYLLDLGSGRFVEPAGVGDILGDYLDQPVLVAVESADATNIQMLGALGYVDDNDDVFQEPCTPSIDFPEADFTENPYFEVGPETTTLDVAGFSITVQDLLLSGAYAQDGSYIAGATLAGAIDTRPLVPLVFADCDEPLDENEDPNPNYPCDDNAICAFAESLFIECQACSDSGDTWCGPENGYDEEGNPDGAIGDRCCLEIFVDSMTATEVDGLVLDRLSEAGSGDSYDPCTVNSNECSALPECI